jgi:hypothetical protein
VLLHLLDFRVVHLHHLEVREEGEGVDLHVLQVLVLLENPP